MIELRESNPYFKGYVEKLNNTPEYSLFRDSVVFIPSPYDRFHVVTDGETLGMIAFDHYGDSKWWFLISEANNLSKQGLEVLFEPPGGLNLIIPDLLSYKALS